jgi:hypothetical protein
MSDTAEFPKPPYVRMPAGLSSLGKARWLVERCEGSGGIQSSDDWVGATTIVCLSCGHTVGYSVRATDQPPWGRVKAHRRNGRACR